MRGNRANYGNKKQMLRLTVRLTAKEAEYIKWCCPYPDKQTVQDGLRIVLQEHAEEHGYEL